MSLTLEGRSLGPEHPTLLIAELSANHDRDLDRALALVDVAADAGWDCLKLQTYDADSLTLRSDHPSMRVDPVWGAATLHELYTASAMPMAFHEPLFERARERGLLPFTSVYDPRDLDFVESLDCPLYKIASFELTFDDLLAAVAATGKPVVLSTGMATFAEIERALEILDRHGAGEAVLLHCCSSYPAPLEALNLRAMVATGERFGRPTGFSDHTLGARAPLAAAAMGAVAVEKHFTDDASRPGPDHRFSATPATLREISEGVAEIHRARGSADKGPTEAEREARASGRRSAFALRDLPCGHRVRAADFRFVRPNAGVPANDAGALVGRRLLHAVAAGHPIGHGDLGA